MMLQLLELGLSPLEASSEDLETFHAIMNDVTPGGAAFATAQVAERSLGHMHRMHAYMQKSRRDASRGRELQRAMPAWVRNSPFEAGGDTSDSEDSDSADEYDSDVDNFNAESHAQPLTQKLKQIVCGDLETPKQSGKLLLAKIELISGPGAGADMQVTEFCALGQASIGEGADRVFQFDPDESNPYAQFSYGKTELKVDWQHGQRMRDLDPGARDTASWLMRNVVALKAARTTQWVNYKGRRCRVLEFVATKKPDTFYLDVETEKRAAKSSIRTKRRPTSLPTTDSVGGWADKVLDHPQVRLFIDEQSFGDLDSALAVLDARQVETKLRLSKDDCGKVFTATPAISFTDDRFAAINAVADDLLVPDTWTLLQQDDFAPHLRTLRRNAKHFGEYSKEYDVYWGLPEQERKSIRDAKGDARFPMQFRWDTICPHCCGSCYQAYDGRLRVFGKFSHATTDERAKRTKQPVRITRREGGVRKKVVYKHGDDHTFEKLLDLHPDVDQPAD